MGVRAYLENGKECFEVMLHVRSRKNRKIRVQKKLKGILTQEEANRIYLKEYQRACSEIAKRESDGLTWGEVIDSWEIWYRRFPSPRWDLGTVRDYIAIANNWTENWLKRPASGLTVSDAFQLIEDAKKRGASIQRQYQIKTTVNVIFKWGMAAGKIVGKDHSPMFGIDLPRKGSEKEPEILSRDEVAVLLQKAEEAEHEWFPVWKFDAYTGMRASELDGLRKEDIELVPREKARELDRSTEAVKNYGLVRVHRQWQKKLKSYGPTKGRYWRTVPVSSQLYSFLVKYLENDFGADEHGRRVFPVYPELRQGRQAFVLKAFCNASGLKSIKFHTLRACFATHLLAAGVPEAKVMKIGGWKDRETMMIYVRLSGIDEAGATEPLDFSMVASEDKIHANVVRLFGAR